MQTLLAGEVAFVDLAYLDGIGFGLVVVAGLWPFPLMRTKRKETSLKRPVI